MVFGLFGRSGVEVSIGLDRPDETYAIGETVGAQIMLAVENGGNIREVRAGLVRQERFQAIDNRLDADLKFRDFYEWRTNEVWVTREVLAGEGALSVNDTFGFAWQIPPGSAPTCAGDIVQVKWLVKVTINRPMAPDQNEELEFGVVSLPTGRPAQSGDFGEMNADSRAVMRLTLPTLEFGESDTVRGRLAIAPSESIDAREVRVELMREERVNVGDRVNIRLTSMQQVQVAASTTLVAGTPVAYDFELSVPTAGSPSHDVGDTVMGWLLVGTIDRPMRGDYTVTQRVGVYTG